MPTLHEGELEFVFPAESSANQFDDAAHGLSHCMKAVDFIVELDDRYLFVEVKDPAHSRALPAARAAFAQELASGALSVTLARKLRDSMLYRWAQEKLDKDVYYVVLIELSGLGPAEYLAVTETLQREVPLARMPASWRRPLVKDAVVLGMAAWNAAGTYGTVKRAAGT